ncbi:hypothetical protein [Bacillus sp. FJAT-28004]|uniref:hypothetical protein n=1 Tax=Bacillus sp. FJAT-28004 TaxID=1679165 RepID=UPI0006B3FF79|nr:hypothetical protein [Bacillus sp. FJAT-28004]
MFTVTVEMTQERKYQLREWINTHENATDQYFMGVYAGLKWMIDKVGVKEHLYSEIPVASPIIIDQAFISECTKKFEENWIDEIWNSGLALAIITVLDLFNIQVIEFPTPKFANKTLN